MSFTYGMEEYDGYLQFTGQGSPESPQEMFGYVQHMFNKAKQKGVRCILVDETRTAIKFDFHDAVITSELLDSEEFQTLGMQVAIVCAPHSLEMYKFFETSLRNRAFNIMVFDDVGEGRAWLLGEG